MKKSMDDIEKILVHEIDSIDTPSQKERIIDKINDGYRPKFRVPRFAFILCVIILVFGISGTVLAVSGIDFRELIGQMRPSYSNMEEVAGDSSVDQDLRLEVIGSGYSSNHAEIFIQVEDLSGSRSLEDCSLMGYSFLPVADSGGGESGLTYYDAATNTAMMKVVLHTGGQFDKEGITLVVTEIAYNQREKLNQLMPLNLSTINKAPDTIQISTDEAQFIALKPQSAMIEFPEFEFLSLSNIGIVDNKLHVQLKRDLTKNVLNGSNVYLQKEGEGGASFKETDFISFYLDENGHPSFEQSGETLYTDYIFDVPDEGLDNYQLYINFEATDLIKGNWELHVQQENIMSPIEMACNERVGGYKIENITIHSFGIIIDGTFSEDVTHPFEDLPVYVVCNNKKIIAYNRSYGSYGNESGIFHATWQTKELDLANVTAIIIDGHTIAIDD